MSSALARTLSQYVSYRGRYLSVGNNEDSREGESKKNNGGQVSCVGQDSSYKG